jgi:parallel beta-helix repeat protein
MRQPALASLFILILLSSFVLIFFSSFGSAEGATVGVSIQADGTVHGTSGIQRNGDVYTFVGNVSGPLYVQRDNIVIDGAGYTLVGGKGRGIVLADRHGVTLKNARVTLDGGYVIDVESATDCALIGNTLIGTPQPIPGLPPPTSPLIGPIGVNLLNSQNITVKDNTITNFFYALSLEQSSGHTITGNNMVDGIVGISIENTTGCVFRSNRMINSGFSIRVYSLYQYENDLDSSNTVDGKPIYYWINAKDKTVPSDAAYIVLVECTNMLIENASPQGIALIATSDSTISRVTMTGRGDGISLLDCSSMSIIDNTLHDGGVGIDIEDSSNNIIRGNMISNHITSGIRLSNASNNLISSNIFANNSCAISVVSFQVSLGKGNVIASNNFTKNDDAITVPCSMEIVGNVFEENNNAILLSGSSGSTITRNTFTNNKNALYISAASNNYIYLNNFLNNDHQVTDAGVNASTQPTKASRTSVGSLQLAAAHISGVNFIPPSPPSTNYWDNGTKGNYWSNYNGTDANGDGVGDTAYHLYENNVDHYPLMNPVADNSTLPEQQQESEDFTEAKLPVEYTIPIVAAIAVAGILSASTYLALKRKKPPMKT